MARFSFAGSAGVSPSTNRPMSSLALGQSPNTTGSGNAVLLAVVVEVAIIVGLRHFFRKHHGG